MRFATPNFTNKTFAIIWMLLLGLAIILVQYFLGEVIVSKQWQIEKSSIKDKPFNSSIPKAIYPSQQCQLSSGQRFKIKAQHLLLYDDQTKKPIPLYAKPVASILCYQQQLYFVENDQYQAKIFVYQKNRLQLIASHLHHIGPYYFLNNTLVLYELGRQRQSKFSPKD